MTDTAVFEEGTRVLAKRDPVIADLLAKTGPIVLPQQTDSNFAALVRAITYQQLAGAAARAIFGRLVAALGDEVTPERLSRLTPADLRAAGLSGAKTASVLDLAAKTLDGSVSLDEASIAAETDDEVIARLTTVRGIGPWTAEIFAMIHLGRPDVLPVGDLGIRKGYALGWKTEVPTEKQLLAIGEAYRPFRSVLSWYCWRADELYGRAKPSAVTGGAI